MKNEKNIFYIKRWDKNSDWDKLGQTPVPPYNIKKNFFSFFIFFSTKNTTLLLLPPYPLFFSLI